MHTIPKSGTPGSKWGNGDRSARLGRWIVLLVLIGALALLTGGKGSDPGESLPGGEYSQDYEADWEAIAELVRNQQLEAASELVAELREIAREDGHEEPWTRALVEEVQIRMALHGYETAVRFLREAEWPDNQLWQSLLELYYAQSLITYFHRYNYEIRQREQVISDETVDLKSWTTDQIAQEIHLAFQRAWSHREAWGERSLGPLAPYIEQNNYPARIRGTLRDAVTYMWANLLADTSLWRPEHSNERFRLDTAALIQGGQDSQLDPADPDLHPLRRIGAILDDLEQWHANHERAEAAAETRYFRLNILFSSLNNEPDKLAIIDHLTDLQHRFDDKYGWWSMGQWLLAEFLRNSPVPLPLMAAHAAAEIGRDRHPDSIGGSRCAHLAAVLEKPSYGLHAMSSDAAHQRSIQITHRNIDQIHFRAWRIDLADRIENLVHYSDPWPRMPEYAAWIHDREPDLAWSEDLPPTPDLEKHQTYTTLPAVRKGAYLVMASVRHDFAEPLNVITRVNMIVSDLVLVERDLGAKREISTFSGTTGAPLPGVTIDLYQNLAGKTEQITTVISDEHGLAYFMVPGRRGSTFFFAHRGEDVILGQRLHSNRGYEPIPVTRSLTYTDRSVYRPGQSVHWKVVAYHGGGNKPEFTTLPDKELIISLHDANNREVAADTLRTNSFGSASGSFVVPLGRLLGLWHLRSSLPGGTQVTVEEYKRPTFEVTVTDPEDPLRLNEPATLTGQVDYYFGLPVTEGEVTWRITRQPHFPRWWWWRRPSQSVQTVASGNTELDEHGTFAVEFTPQADERLSDAKGVSYRYQLHVDVTSEGGETRSAQRGFRIGFLAVDARVETDRGFQHAGQDFELTIRRTSLDGVARPGEGSWRLVALAQPEHSVLPADRPVTFPPGDDNPYGTPGDLQNPRWRPEVEVERVLASWPDGDRLDSGTLEHDENGVGLVELAGLAAGAYRLHYETEDDFGAPCQRQHEFLVVDRQTTPLALPLVLIAEQPAVAVGDTARLLAHSGLPEQEIVLELMYNGHRHQRQVLLSGHDPSLLEIPITAELRGGFTIRLSTLRDFQFLDLSERIQVPFDNRQLEVEFATFRDRLRPGTEETFRVRVRDATGSRDENLLAKGAAELLAYMYDRSLDIFAGHNPPQPIALFSINQHIPRMQTTLGSANQRRVGGKGFQVRLPFPNLYEDALRLLSSYGIGGPGRRSRSSSSRVGYGGARSNNIPDEILSDGATWSRSRA